MIHFALEGDRAVAAALRQLDSRIKREILRQALAAAWKRVLELADEGAPVDTGNLKAHLRLIARRGKRGEVAVDVALERVPYAAAEEFGTDRTRDHKGEHFMIRAFDERGPGAAREARREILSGLERLLR